MTAFIAPRRSGVEAESSIAESADVAHYRTHHFAGREAWEIAKISQYTSAAEAVIDENNNAVAQAIYMNAMELLRNEHAHRRELDARARIAFLKSVL